MVFGNSLSSDFTLRQGRIETVLQISAPLLRYISRTLEEIPHLTCLFDADGYIVDLHSSQDFESFLFDTGVRVGVDMADPVVGNNAIEKSLQTGCFESVIGNEHEKDFFKNWACYAAPLTGAKDDIVGGICIGVALEYRDRVKPTMLQIAAEAIQAELWRRSVSQELELARAHWTAILQGIDEIGGCALAVVDEDGFVLLANKEMACSVGFNCEEELLNKNIGSVFKDDLLVMHTIRDKIPRNSTLVRTDCNGNRKTWKSTAIPVIDQGKAVASLVFAIDVTQVDYTHQYLQKLETEKDRYELMGEVIHEIRNPLTAIHAQAQVAAKFSVEDRTKNRMARIVEQIDRLNALLTSLLKPDENRHGECETSDMADLPITIESVVDFFRPKCEQRSIKIRFTFDGSEDMGQYPSRLITQVLSNLLTNAIDAVQNCHPKEVDVCLHKQQDQVIISVRDSGIGIPDHLLPRIFERCFTTKKTGAGLGLSVVRDIVEKRLCGKIAVQAASTTGATFEVSLPRIEH